MPFFAKHIYICIATMFLSICTITAQVCHSIDHTDVGTYTDRDHIHKSLSTDSIGLASSDNYDIIYHRISVKVDPAVRYIAGSVTSYFRPDRSLRQMSFDLSDSMTVDSIYYHGVPLPGFTHSHNAITISFPAVITELDSVVVFYGGVPPSTGFGSFNLDMHDSVPVLWTLSEPYGARDWLPCKMTLTDKVDSFDIYINVPHGNRAASNGLLTDSQATGNTMTYHWRHRYPIATYLIGIAVTNYTAHSFTVPTQYGDITVLQYAYPEHEQEWEQSDSNIGRALQLYSNLFGAYPFIKEKYGHAQFGWGGGMEHQTMSFVYNVGFELVNHEMGHQWFGDKLTCDSWSEIWLNEGFAVFLSGLCYERIQPEWWYAFRSVTLNSALRSRDGTVLCDDTVSVPRIFNSSLSYRRGCYLLHMLRWVLGDDAFFAGLKSYVNDPALAYKFSKTTLLKKHMEDQSGRDLTVFFDQWFYKGGYPSYALDWAQHGSKLFLRLSQATSSPAVNFFVMPVPIRFYGNGKDTTLVLDNKSSGQEFSYNLPFSVDSVKIDPELWLLSDSNTTSRIAFPAAGGSITLQPNPMHDNVIIWYDSQKLGKVSITFFDLSGQPVTAIAVPAGGGDYYTASIGFLPAGVYVAKITTESGTSTHRVVKF